MDFIRGKLCLLIGLTAALAACGGSGDENEIGSSSGGSTASAAERAYNGSNDEATLSQNNRDQFLISIFSDTGLNGIPEALGFESSLDSLRNRIFSTGTTDFQQAVACFPGTYDASAISNSNFSFFNISVNYTDCELNGITLDGDLQTQASYDGSFSAGAEKLSESLTYSDLNVTGFGFSRALAGDEESEFNLLGGSRSIIKNVTVTNTDSGSQDFYDDISLEVDESEPFPANIERMSGTFFHSENGFVSVNIIGSIRYSGNAILISGAAGSDILVDYEDQTDEIIITLDEDGDGSPESTQSLTRSAFDQLVNP